MSWAEDPPRPAVPTCRGFCETEPHHVDPIGERCHNRRDAHPGVDARLHLYPPAVPARGTLMYLKSVQVQGFKTFAKKTELFFEPGVTAIVGPNGAGKSNLVDASRWVLGERSARQLRGTRMEEVVYSGGARRSPSGMAEVRIVIDNGDGRLQVPYGEIEVLRRGYRSGESDYWINGTRCRLRDIEQLFASTG